MYLQKLPNLNQLPVELLETIPKLNPGQLAIFRSLKIANDVDAETNKVTIRHTRLFIPYRDTIRYKDEFYPIGIPRKVDNKGQVVEFESEVFGLGIRNFDGKFILSGDNMEDQRKYMFLMLSNHRKGNPFRDSSYPALVEYIDAPAESKLSRKRRSLLKSALDIAENLSIKQVKEVIAALNMNEHQDEVLLRDIVEAYAEANTELFIKSYQDPSFLQSALIKRASDAGIIYWDQRTSKVRWADASQTVLATLEPDATKNWVRSFSEYCISNGAGQKYLKEIRKKLNDKTPSFSESEPEFNGQAGPGPEVGLGDGNPGTENFDNL